MRQRKAFCRQLIGESSCARKETVNMDISYKVLFSDLSLANGKKTVFPELNRLNFFHLRYFK